MLEAMAHSSSETVQGKFSVCLENKKIPLRCTPLSKYFLQDRVMTLLLEVHCEVPAQVVC